MIRFVLAAILADFVAPHPYAEQYRDHFLQPPAWAEGGSWAFPLGTDDVGRCIYSRIVYGARWTLYVVILVAVVADHGRGRVIMPCNDLPAQPTLIEKNCTVNDTAQDSDKTEEIDDRHDALHFRGDTDKKAAGVLPPPAFDL